MPNWCNNLITVSGPTDAIVSLVRSRFDLARILPEPPLAGDALQDWRAETWGTKWNVDPDEVYLRLDPPELESQTLHVGFDSAWSPPLGCYAALTAQGLRVRALYHEPGMDFMGVWEDGEDRVYEVSEYPPEDPFWILGDGRELDEAFELLESLREEALDE